jgi:hypothetical protein
MGSTDELFNRSCFVFNKMTLGAVAALTLILGAPPVLAQTSPSDARQTEQSDQASGNIRGERVLPGRIGGRQRNQRQERPKEAPPAATPEQVLAAAQAQITTAGIDCQVTEAINPGVVGESQVYETACAQGPGYILIASTPPQAFNCLELAGTAYVARQNDPAADVGQQCGLPANQNGLQLISSWAREAGVTCTVDEALAVGKSEANNIVYEVGCAGVDGYWLEKANGQWTLQDCLQIVSTGGNCRFTTAEEQNATLQAKLVGTEAADCAVQQVRVMGTNANGRFYEVKCAAEGEGFIARIKDGSTEQTYPCATAQRIGGGCTLTPTPAAAPASQD